MQAQGLKRDAPPENMESRYAGKEFLVYAQTAQRQAASPLAAPAAWQAPTDHRLYCGHAQISANGWACFQRAIFVRVRSLIRNLVQRVGLDLRNYRPLVGDPYLAQEYLLRSSRCRTVFDIGAFQGDATRRYAELFPEAEIYAFEPYPPSYEALVAKYSATPRVHLVNAAVSSRTGDATFYVNGVPATNSLLPRPSGSHRYFSPEAVTRSTISVPTVSIDEYRAKHGIAVPDILKMDIQGMELHALYGADETLKSGGISLIFSEVTFVPHYEGGVLFDQLSSHLRERGYTLFNVYELHSANVGQLRFGDAIFIADRLRATAIDMLSE
jgi:FkbM family methyltransferase